MRVRLIAGAVVIAIAVWLCASGAYHVLEPSNLQRWMLDAGVWGSLLFVIAHGGLQPLGVRSIVFLLSAPLIWTPAEAVLLSWTGAMLASVLSFAFARFVARDWVQRRAPARFRRFDDRLSADGFRTVTMLRLVFYTTPALQYGLGVSRVRFAPFLLGTAVGVLPFTLVMTLFGVQIGAFLSGLLQ